MAKSVAVGRRKSKKEAEDTFVGVAQDNDARLTVDLPSNLHKQFKIWAVQNDKKMNEILREHIRDLVKS
jgi:hypothetical protein